MDNLQHNIKEYFQAKINLIKLEISDEIGGILSKIIMLIFGLFVSLVLLLLALVVIEIGMAILLDSHLYGAIATLGVFVILFVIIVIFFKTKLTSIITNKIYDDLIEKLMKENEKNNK